MLSTRANEQFIATIFGQKGSGKSHLMRYLLCEVVEPKAVVVVFSKTAKVNNAYSFVPDQWVHHEFDLEKVKNIVDINSRIADAGYKPPQTILVFDDCIDKAIYTDFFKDLIYYHRHYNISLIMAFQYIAGSCPTALRCNIDYAFIFFHNDLNSCKTLHTAFGNLYGDSQKAFASEVSELQKHEFITLSKHTNPKVSINKCPAKVGYPSIKYKSKIRLSYLDKL